MNSLSSGAAPSRLPKGLVAHRIAGGDTALELVERSESRILAEEHPSLEPPGQRGADLVFGKRANGDGEDVIELFERAFLGLGNPEEDHDEGEHVHSGVEAKCSDNTEGAEETGETDGEHGRPAEAGGNRETHADLTMRKGEDLGRVGEWHGALTR